MTYIENNYRKGTKKCIPANIQSFTTYYNYYLLITLTYSHYVYHIKCMIGTSDTTQYAICIF